MPNSNEVNKALEVNFLSKDRFAEEIEAMVLDTKMSYIEAIVEYCEEKGIEVESVSKLISKPLKEKLKYEATELNYLKKTSRGKLPL